jgi:glycosyltransferase involved in cell wall biosynthesis
VKVSFIATVYNEESAVKPLLQSLFSQSKFPDEIIIVDGGSTDNTVSEISSFKFPDSCDKAKIKLLFKTGNRSVGRNEAIKNSTSEIIVCSDSGCTLDKDWIKNITKPFANSKVDVVAGYYKGEGKKIFEKCLIPYVLVMPDRVDSRNFLPATRSMAFRKSIWEKVKGFPEEFSNNEDYVFAKRLKKINANILFEKKAIVNWIPRANLKESFIMFYRFAKGDAESHIIRPKVILIFLRYTVGIFLIVPYAISKSDLLLNILFFIMPAYILWSIIKNYKYVGDSRAIFHLPLIQITSDVAVMVGTVRGLIG